MADSTVKVNFLGDASALKRATDDATDHLSKFSSHIGTIAKTAALGFAAIGAGAVIGMKPLISAASDLEETVSKMNQIFGNDAEYIETWSKKSAKAFGQSQQAAIDAAAGFAGLGKAAGLQGKELIGFSTKLTELASDLASFGNTTPEEAILALGSGLRGEAEPLRKYNILLDDATLRQKALAIGLIKTTKDALTPQQKTLASYAVILEQTKDAQGDFARTSGGLANQQRILSAQFKDVQAQIGQFLLPIVTKFVTALNSKLIPAVRDVVGIFSSNGLSGGIRLLAHRFEEAWPAIKAALGRVLASIGAWIADVAPVVGRQLVAWGEQFIRWVGPQIPPLLVKLGELVATVAQWLVDRAPELGDKLGKWAGEFIAWVGPQIIPLLGELGKLLGKITVWLVEEGIPKLAEAAKKFWSQLAIEAAAVAPEVIAQLELVAVKVKLWLENDAGDQIAEGAKKFGRAIVNYMIEGVNSMGDALASAILQKVPFAPEVFSTFAGGGSALAGATANGLPAPKPSVRQQLDNWANNGLPTVTANINIDGTNVSKAMIDLDRRFN